VCPQFDPGSRHHIQKSLKHCLGLFLWPAFGAADDLSHLDATIDFEKNFARWA
jgi:hypothetical protein